MDARYSTAELPARIPRLESPGHMKYRPDIDGLRAVAVVSVIFYHARLTLVSGGFVGVDIFFVISGFLITSILMQEMERGRFSILSFYDRRIRRIFPALFAVLSFVAITGCLIFPDRQLKELSDALVATVLFASNILFWRRYGYFNESASTQPVIHTWSLAVEEQFYIVFPILLFALFRWFRRRDLIAILIIAALVSLAGSEWAAYRFPKMAFYLAPFRAWELLLGSLVALGFFPPIRAQWFRETMALAGAGCIVWSIFLFTSRTVFPGFNALVPCIGTALIIHSGRHGSSKISRCLSFGPVVFVGLISYSLYLWHWPLFVFAQLYNFGDLSITQVYGVIALTFVLAALTWRYIESPFRRKQLFAEKTALFRAATIAIALGLLIGTAGHATRGWAARLPPDARRLESAEGNFNKRRNECHNSDLRVTSYEQKCVYGTPGIVPHYAIWGDSHAAELVTALGDIAAAHGQAILQISYSNCAPSFGDEAPTGIRCRDHNNAVFRKLAADRSKQLVFLNSRYTEDFSEDGFRAVVEGLRAAGKKVVVVYPFPSADNSVPVLLTSAVMRGRDPRTLSISYVKYKKEKAKAFAFLDSLPRDITRIYPHQRLCTETGCAMMEDGIPLYFDSNHISIAGAKYLEPLFLSSFDNSNVRVDAGCRRAQSSSREPHGCIGQN
jgi:peptidoglycan/LPS O-acetylase OafA/YrhL